jgi:hypothetical protein
MCHHQKIRKEKRRFDGCCSSRLAVKRRKRKEGRNAAKTQRTTVALC